MNREYKYSELKESTLLMQKRTPSFGWIITLLTLLLMIAIIILAALTSKTYIVKANAMAVSEIKSNIMNKVNAPIKTICVTEGQSVVKGDVLFEFDSNQVKTQIEQVNVAIEFIETKKQNIVIVINFIENYKIQDEYSKINPFNKNDISEKSYYLSCAQFIDYTLEKNDPDGVPNSGDEIAKTQDEIDTIKINFISQQLQSIEQYEYELTSNIGQKEALIKTLEDYYVRAQSDGKVHIVAGLSIGTVLQAGTMIGSISNLDNLCFDSVVESVDRSKINLNDDVDIILGGIMQSEFGVLKGKIVSIDSDSMQSEQGNIYYRVIIKADNYILENKKGEQITIAPGMVAECRIKYEQTTWLKWAFEQIGVKFR